MGPEAPQLLKMLPTFSQDCVGKAYDSYPAMQLSPSGKLGQKFQLFEKEKVKVFLLRRHCRASGYASTETAAAPAALLSLFRESEVCFRREMRGVAGFTQ